MPRKDLVTYPKKVSYRKHPGMVAWLLHRVTGVFVGLYLIMHILGKSAVISAFDGITSYSAVKAVFLFTFAFHALNGVRIVTMEFGNGYKHENSSKYFMAALFIAIVATVFGSIPIFRS